jgi:hypothetical protein
MFIDGGEISTSFISNKGAWDSSTEYSSGDVVTFAFKPSGDDSYTFKYVSLVDENTNHSPSSDLSSLDTQYWMALTYDSVLSTKSNSVYITDVNSALDSQTKYDLVLSNKVSGSSYRSLKSDYTLGNPNIYALGGKLCDTRGELAPSSVFGIVNGSYIKTGQTLYINTDIPASVITSMLSNLALTEATEIEGQDVPLSAIIFEDDVIGREGIYSADLSALGGSGYVIFLAKTSDGQADEYEEVLFISDVSDPVNETILTEFFPTFVMPSDPGWTKSYVDFTTPVHPISVLKKQSTEIKTAYSKYVTNSFTTDRRMWDLVQFMIDYNIGTVLNTPV